MQTTLMRDTDKQEKLFTHGHLISKTQPMKNRNIQTDTAKMQTYRICSFHSRQTVQSNYIYPDSMKMFAINATLLAKALTTECYLDSI